MSLMDDIRKEIECLNKTDRNSEKRFLPEDGRAMRRVPQSVLQQCIARYTQYVYTELSDIVSQTPSSEKAMIEKLKHFLHEQWNKTAGTALCYTAIPYEKVSQCCYVLAEKLCEYEASLGVDADNQPPAIALDYLLPPSVHRESIDAHFMDLCPVKPLVFSVAEQGEYQHLLTQTVQDDEAMARFHSLRHVKIAYDKQQQFITAGWLALKGEWLTPNVPIARIMSSHIISDAGHLIPVTVLTLEKPINPFGLGSCLSAHELHRLAMHSERTQMVMYARKELDALSSDTGHLLGQLNRLIRILKLASFQGEGTEETPSSLVYPTILAFAAYYNHPNIQSKILTLPQPLKLAIEHLFEAASEKNAIGRIVTCIDQRQSEIAQAIMGHEPLLSDISVTHSEERHQILIKAARETLQSAQDELNAAFQQGRCSGRDRLSIDKSILGALNVTLLLNNLDDLKILLDLPQDMLKDILLSQTRIMQHIIPDIATLVWLIHDINLAQLDNLLFAIQSWLLEILVVSSEDINAILSSLNGDKFDGVYRALRDAPVLSWSLNDILAYFSHDSDILARIKNLSSYSDRLKIAYFEKRWDIVDEFLHSTDSHRLNAEAIADVLVDAAADGYCELATKILSMMSDNRPNLQTIAEACLAAAAGGQVDMVILFTRLTEENRLNHRTVETALAIAAASGHTHLVKTLLDLTGEHRLNQHAITRALVGATEEVITYLLGLTDDNRLNRQCSADALIQASRLGRFACVKAILALTGDHRPNPNAVSEALLVAIPQRNTALLVEFLSLTGDNRPNQRAISVLFIEAVEWQNRRIIVKILGLPGDNRPHQDVVTESLIEAARFRKVNIVMAILSLKDDNWPTQQTLSEILIEAARLGHADVLRCIMSRTEQNRLNQEMISEALLEAVHGDHTEAAIQLLRVTGDHKPNRSAVTEALRYAHRRGCWLIVSQMVDLTEDNKPEPTELLKAYFGFLESVYLEQFKLGVVVIAAVVGILAFINERIVSMPDINFTQDNTFSK